MSEFCRQCLFFQDISKKSSGPFAEEGLRPEIIALLQIYLWSKGGFLGPGAKGVCVARYTKIRNQEIVHVTETTGNRACHVCNEKGERLFFYAADATV